ncbi:Oidioi.mRNA.OKI2018_I69.chr2.g6986.t1.cds [Oikopleura dioica]|uniref:Oidioi.mRNA.OKI2018_I69.chr2.g6986.t1.cds n=1 Tax=Oikopleura dioica TaxID=34765 RepID=A0ABN7T9J4_OIKDI|nr:Oidioi.mRNA.OKI2018_I69.chr2.g6986.t1.cds [Oikopleura dioica]
METEIGNSEAGEHVDSERTDVISKLLTVLGATYESSSSKLELIGDIYGEKGELPVLDVKNLLSLRLTPLDYQKYLKLSSRLESNGVLSKTNKVFEFFEALSRPAAWNSSFSVRNDGDNELFTQLKNSDFPSFDYLDSSLSSTWKPREADNLTLVGRATGKLIPETRLVRDCLLVMIGAHGHYVKIDPANGSVRPFIVDPGVRVDPRHASMSECLGEFGFYVIEIEKLFEIKKNDNSVVCRTFLTILHEIMNEYKQFVANFKTQKNVTFMSIIAAGNIWLQKLELLYLITWNIREKRGAPILSVVHHFSVHGGAEISEMVHRILAVLQKTYEQMIYRWIFEGQIKDSCDEFMIDERRNAKPEEFWSNKYYLRKTHMPSYIKTSFADAILLCGKNISFLRSECGQVVRNLQQEAVADYNALPEEMKYKDRLEHFVKFCSRTTSEKVVKVLLEEYHLKDHFVGLRQYMLLGHGDFIQALFDKLRSDLDQPAEVIFRHNFKEPLSFAIDTSTADNDKEYVKKCVSVRLHDINPGDTGWDVFSLNYSVEGPLVAIFPVTVMRRYIRIFNFLLRAKRMEHNLNYVWGQSMCLKHYPRALPNVTDIFTSISRLLQEMLFFVNKLQYFINIEVVGVAWSRLEENIESAKNVDDLFEAHLKFLRKIEDGCLLSQEHWQKVQTIRSVFDQIVRFETLAKKVFSETEAFCSFPDQNAAFPTNLIKHTITLGNIRHVYQQMVRSFLDIIKTQSNQTLSTLSWSLNYSDFYTVTALPTS